MKKLLYLIGVLNLGLLQGSKELSVSTLYALTKHVLHIHKHNDTRCTHGGQQIPIIVACTSACADIIINGCQTGPIRLGTSDATSLTLATNGCSDRVVIDQNGAVVVNMPTAGEALTVNGNIVVPVVNAAETQGIVKLGGTGPTRVNMYESGIRNFFAGSSPVNTVVTGTNNISIGIGANTALTAASNTIAIGTAASATGSDSVVLGDGANSTFARTIVLGSQDSTNTGAAPTAGAVNAIAMGSGSAAQSGAVASGISSIALGGSDGFSAGATVTSSRSVGIGINATASGSQCVAMGSASGVVNGSAPRAGPTSGSIALGSACASNAGPRANGGGAIALGGADNVFAGASATLDSIAIGVNSTTALSESCIIVGSASGIVGGNGPSSSSIGAIAVGSAQGALPGASAGFTGVALGASDGVFAGATAGSDSTIAIGVNATTSIFQSIAVGSASGAAGGTAPTASGGANAIAIGSARLSNAGPSATDVGVIALGSADDVFAGPSINGSGTRSVLIGINSTASSSACIAIGSASGIPGGVGPNTVSFAGAVAIGSARSSLASATTNGAGSIALGGSDGVFAGAAAIGGIAIAMGVNATASANFSVTVGSASGVAGGTAPTATNFAGIALGGANGALAGANVTGVAATSLGGSDGVSAGASAGATRAVAIGVGATIVQTDCILLGNATNTAVRVGIGTAAPAAKLDIVGVDGTPVWRFNQVNPAIGNSITWLHPYRSPGPGTAVYYNGIDATSVYWVGLGSSRRYKTNIRPITHESSIIYSLNPVLYDSREEYGEGKDVSGFIAEEVYEVAPRLAVLNSNNQPENVAYNSLHALAIAELQRCRKILAAQRLFLQEQAHILKLLQCEMAELNNLYE